MPPCVAHPADARSGVAQTNASIPRVPDRSCPELPRGARFSERDLLSRPTLPYSQAWVNGTPIDARLRSEEGLDVLSSRWPS